MSRYDDGFARSFGCEMRAELDARSRGETTGFGRHNNDIETPRVFTNEERLAYYRAHGLDACDDYPGGDAGFEADVLSGEFARRRVRAREATT